MHEVGTCSLPSSDSQAKISGQAGEYLELVKGGNKSSLLVDRAIVTPLLVLDG